ELGPVELPSPGDEDEQVVTLATTDHQCPQQRAEGYPLEPGALLGAPGPLGAHDLVLEIGVGERLECGVVGHVEDVRSHFSVAARTSWSSRSKSACVSCAWLSVMSKTLYITFPSLHESTRISPPNGPIAQYV